MSTDVGFIGIGNMGFGMAGNVRRKMPSSATLHILDVDSAACQRFAEKFASFGPIKTASSAKQLACDSGVVISMLPMDQHARAVYLDEQDGVIAANGGSNKLILECSTINVATTREIGEEIRKAGVGRYVDTPVSGGVAGAEAGTLSFFCGYSATDTSDSVADRIKDVLSWMGASERINFCGDIGAGLVCKIVNNYMSLTNMVAAAEGMAFGMRQGVDKKMLWKCVTGSSGNSWMMENMQPVPGIVETSSSSNGYKPGFRAAMSVKDISLGVRMAQQVGIDATMGETALKTWEKVAQDPRTSDLDFSSIWLHINDELAAFTNST